MNLVRDIYSVMWFRCL